MGLADGFLSSVQTAHSKMWVYFLEHPLGTQDGMMCFTLFSAQFRSAHCPAERYRSPQDFFIVGTCLDALLFGCGFMLLPLQGVTDSTFIYPRRCRWAMGFCPFGAICGRVLFLVSGWGLERPERAATKCSKPNGKRSDALGYGSAVHVRPEGAKALLKDNALFLCVQTIFMLLPFQGVGSAFLIPRVSLRLPWAMCWLPFQGVFAQNF